MRPSISSELLGSVFFSVNQKVGYFNALLSQTSVFACGFGSL